MRNTRVGFFFGRSAFLGSVAEESQITCLGLVKSDGRTLAHLLGGVAGQSETEEFHYLLGKTRAVHSKTILAAP